ncbi:hypothetical protein PPYR_06653 [Photinus pyralis]|nr:zinc finger protein 226-like isoform X2 [Photinus pyralis]KAB0798773.1 hypothetical protein PPYR_06653 [Photinus pyralis]
MENVEYDLSKICRVCKSEAACMAYVFVNEENDDGGPRIDEMLMACTSVEVNYGDGLPHVICRECKEQLTSAYCFKKLCEDTDTTLREYLRATKGSGGVKEEYYQSPIPVPVTEHDITYVQDELDADDVEFTTSDNVKLDPDEELQLDDDYIRFLENSQVLLTCRTCSKCFTTLDGLKCHKRLHNGSLFKCKQCGKQYTRQNHLQRHEQLHGPRKVHVCKICNKTLTRFEHLKRHLVTHLKEKPFACNKCNRGFTRSEHLMNHVHKCKGDRVHICDICNKGFNREDSLAVHRHLHDNKQPVLPTLDNLDNIDEHYLEIEYAEPNEPSAYSESSQSDAEPEAPAESIEPQVDIAENSDQIKLAVIKDVPNIETDTEIYGELDPEELLEAKSKIVAEMLEGDVLYDVMKQERENSDSGHSEYLPTKSITRMKRRRGRPRKSFSPKSSRPRGRPSLPKVKVEITDDNSDIDGEFACPNCDKVFSTMHMLEKHAEKHEGLKIHTCTVCEKKFTRANHLKRHMLCHLEEKPYGCDVCSKRFNRRDHLLQHTKLHSRAQEFECEVCKRLFSRHDHLTKHMATKHSVGEKIVTEKKFQCSVCLKAFTTEKYRDVHMKGHTGDKKYQCRTCDKTFLSKSHLTEHIKFHNENSKKFLCSECGQRFIRNDYLVIHMRRHRGEKPFKCKYCGKGFPRTTDLTVHERYHTGEKTHLCTICGRGFGRAYNLTVHMRTHTGEKPYRCTYCDAAFAQGNDLKAHVRRHTGERFHCDLCSESFLMGYLLTQHKRTVHGLNVVSHIRRLQPVSLNRDQQADFEPITIPLPPAVVSVSAFNNHIKQDLDDIDDPSVIPNAAPNANFDPQIQSQLTVAQLQQMAPL